MERKVIYTDLTGMKFGRLTVLHKTERPKHSKSDKTHYLCECECGNQKIVASTSLTGGNTKSCGCYKREQTIKRTKSHGLSKTRFFKLFYNMKRRCENPEHNEYHNYGAKGIKVEWDKFEEFAEDMHQSYLDFEEMHSKNTPSIDRIDSSKNYCKENCRWVTQLEQARNRNDNISVIVKDVEYSTLSELAEAYDLSYQLVYSRYKNGKRNEELIAEKKNSNRGTNHNGIEVEVNGITYDSLSSLQKDYPYISLVSITKRYKKGLRGTDLIAPKHHYNNSNNR